jgi:sugar phosphate isomerase/epimerase
MSDAVFAHDAFLSHSAKEKEVVRAVAERLRADGLRVWFGEWEIRPGDSIPAKIEEGLEHSRVLVLCMSAHAFGSDWARVACPAVASEQRRKAGTHGSGNLSEGI